MRFAVVETRPRRRPRSRPPPGICQQSELGRPFCDAPKGVTIGGVLITYLSLALNGEWFKTSGICHRVMLSILSVQSFTGSGASLSSRLSIAHSLSPSRTHTHTQTLFFLTRRVASSCATCISNSCAREITSRPPSVAGIRFSELGLHIFTSAVEM